jgi:hypothetical protein
LLQEFLEEVENVSAGSKDLRRTSEGTCAFDYVLIPIIKNKGCFVDEVLVFSVSDFVSVSNVSWCVTGLSSVVERVSSFSLELIRV